jgi:hypothetical protein
MLLMIPSGRDRADAARECLAELCRLASGAGTAEAAIALHSKHSLRGSAIEEVLGASASERLLNGSVEVSGIQLHLITEKIRSRFQRGPLVAAYVSPRFLPELLSDDRVTDLIYLPWSPRDEALFFHQHHPMILGDADGWAPVLPEEATAEREEEARRSPDGVRESLRPEERVLPLEHTIDPGFVNHRRIEAIVGPEGRAMIDRAIAQLPALPEGLRLVRIAGIYSEVMLAFCRVVGVRPLGRLMAERKGWMFCSTETVGACRNFYQVERPVNRWRSPGRLSIPVEFHYSKVHITSDTLRSELRRGALLSIIAELHSASNERIVFHPLVMGGPWLRSPDPKWQVAAMWWGTEFFENVVEDFDEFSAVKKAPKPLSCEPMRGISEGAFKQCLAEILGGEVTKDWGGESSDFYTAHLHLAGRRVSGAFLLKGPARFAPMRLNNLGKNNDQIVRLSNEPADVLFVQHCHEITSPVRSTLRAFSVQPSRPRRYCLVDGRDSLWLLQAYGAYERAVFLSSAQSLRR